MRTPSFYSENCYTGARIINEAVRSIGGRVEMDAYGNPTQNIYIRKVQRVGGKLQNTVVLPTSRRRSGRRAGRRRPTSRP